MNHLKRLHEYNKDRYPYLSRLAVGAIMWFELYFIVILNQGVTWDTIRPVLGFREAIGAFTLFCFLWWLRIADDLKDEETDKVLFPDRALPTGRISRKELQWFCVPLIAIPLILNLIFMPNRWFCVFLYTYGSLMAVWFFQKHKIQPSLPMALFTHNPVQIVMNLYTLSYVVMVYGIKWVSLTNFLAIFTLYFPALIWEVSRKIRAPKDETDYVTYSKLFGYKRATNFVLIPGLEPQQAVRRTAAPPGVLDDLEVPAVQERPREMDPRVQGRGLYLPAGGHDDLHDRPVPDRRLHRLVTRTQGENGESRKPDIITRQRLPGPRLHGGDRRDRGPLVLGGGPLCCALDL